MHWPLKNVSLTDRFYRNPFTSDNKQLTTWGSSGRSRFGFLTVLVDSLRAGILAALVFTGGGSSPIPLIGVVGVVVSAFRFTPFLT